MKSFAKRIIRFILPMILLTIAMNVNVVYPQDEYSVEQKIDLEGISNTDGEPAESPLVITPPAIPKIRIQKPGEIFINSISMKLVWIPPGEFMMGSGCSVEKLAREYDTKEEVFVNEHPQHKVRISKGFWMGQTEVTQGQYKAVMGSSPWSGMKFVQASDNNAASYISWYDAIEFCNKLSEKEGLEPVYVVTKKEVVVRDSTKGLWGLGAKPEKREKVTIVEFRTSAKGYCLPTEAQWEYACRAGTRTRFSFGDSDSSLGEYAWFSGNTTVEGQKYAHQVGQKKPNAFGLYDMYGNIWEWCSDWYDEGYYAKSPSVDPQGPNTGTSRVLRGASWYSDPRSFRSAYRLFRSLPVLRFYFFGFRVVYTGLASGTFDSRYPPQAALDPIETPAEHKARLKRQARERAEQESKEKFASLMVQARANKEKGKEALGLLEEALKLYPGNIEALALQKKIRGYFDQNPGDIMTNSIGMKLVWIPPGDFMMGTSPPSSFSEARQYYSSQAPKHQVKISKGFQMGAHEVTEAQWQSVMGTNPSPFRGDLPVVKVSWNDAIVFCNKLSEKEGLEPVYVIEEKEVLVRDSTKGLLGLGAKPEKREKVTIVEFHTAARGYCLPTEAQWEYACRAGTRTRYSFGDNDSSLGEYAWHERNSGQTRRPVGQKQPNPFGLYDMYGNVWEWCSDWKDDGYYSKSPSVDPQGPNTGTSRVLRGGSWTTTPGLFCLTAHRHGFPTDVRSPHFGFRVALLNF